MKTENNTHEYYVSLETAKMLKEAGFDWKCMKCYNHEVMFDMESDEIREQCPQHSSYDVLAPTIDVAQRWLREVRMHDVFASPCNGLYFYTVRKYYHEGKVDYFDYPNKDAFDTYEEALEAGIKKALEIILEKG